VKSLWQAVSFLAVVHLLTLSLFAAWLWRSDRLDGDRVRQVREIFSRTIAEEQSANEGDLEVAPGPDEESIARQRASADQLGMLTAMQQQERQTTRRLQDETDMLTRQFEAMNEQTELDRRQFDAERQSWRGAIAEEWQRKNDEQFAQTVRLYESLPPKQAKAMLLSLVEQGQKDQAVSYLDAMAPRTATKILKELKAPEEILLATELLEDLRRFGLGAVAEEDLLDEQPAANPERTDA
jgi:hypothetical protein